MFHILCIASGSFSSVVHKKVKNLYQHFKIKLKLYKAVDTSKNHRNATAVTQIIILQDGSWEIYYLFAIAILFKLLLSENRSYN